MTKCTICRIIAPSATSIDIDGVPKHQLCARCLSELLTKEFGSDLSSSSDPDSDSSASDPFSAADDKVDSPDENPSEEIVKPENLIHNQLVDDRDGQIIDFSIPDVQSEKTVQSNLKLQCTLCNERVTNRRSLASHMRKFHPEEKINRCHICRLFFKGAESLEQHIRDNHNGFAHMCTVCLEGFGKGDKEEHEKACLGRLTFRCSICEEHYTSKVALWKHFNGHEIDENSKESSYKETRSFQKIFCCALCDDGLGYEENAYWNHIHHEHDGRHLRCSDCGKTFRTRKHMVVHTGVQCKVGLKAREKAARLHQPIESFCKFCSKSFRNRTLLQNHVAKIHKAKPIVCDVCGLSLANRNQMRYHKTKVHTEPTEQCPHCPKLFHLATDLRQHLTTHETIGKFVCEECGQLFKRKVGLDLHIRSHQNKSGQISKRLNPRGSGNFVCEICDKRFKHNYLLVTHTKIHDPNRVLEKKYNCKECDKRFATSAGLYYHMKAKYVHQRMTCPVCNTLVKGKDRFQEHLAIHSEQNI